MLYWCYFLDISLTSFLISLASPLNNSRQGISTPPCGKSVEYFLLPVTWQFITPPLRINSVHILEIFRCKWPTIVESLITATAYMSAALPCSRWHSSSSPTTASQSSLYMWYPLMQDSFWNVSILDFVEQVANLSRNVAKNIEIFTCNYNYIYIRVKNFDVYQFSSRGRSDEN